MKSRVIKCDFKGAYNTQHGDLYNFNVEFEDGTSGMYTSKSKDNPKFVVGQEAEYTTEVKSGVKNGKEWSFVKIKTVQQQQGSSYGYKKPSNVSALDMARRMYNSSQSTEKKWSVDDMMKTATWILSEINKGVDVVSLETAATIECAEALNKKSITSANLVKNTKIFEEWLKNNK